MISNIRFNKQVSPITRTSVNGSVYACCFLKGKMVKSVVSNFLFKLSVSLSDD